MDLEAPWHAKVEWALRQIEARSITKGCSGAELDRFQRDRGLELPDAYVRFLAAVGAEPGLFLRGSDLRFDQLDGLQAGARDLLADCAGPALPATTFVFCAHQGYQFLCFDLGEGPDPPVRYYLEGNDRLETVAPAFSEWLVQTVRDELPRPASPR